MDNTLNIYEHRDMFKEMQRCQELCNAYNAIPTTELDIRMDFLRHIFGKAEGEFVFFSPFKCSLGYNIEVGNNVAVNSYCTILDGGKVKFGNDIFVGPNVQIISSGHSVDPKKRKEGFGYQNDVVIEDNVYIGAGVTIVCGEKRGITIGKNSLIGAGAVVTRDVPPNVLVAGNPAKVIRKIGEDEE